MRGQWQSQTRRLNRHYQSAKQITLKPYPYTVNINKPLVYFAKKGWQVWDGFYTNSWVDAYNDDINLNLVSEYPSDDIYVVTNEFSVYYELTVSNVSMVSVRSNYNTQESDYMASSSYSKENEGVSISTTSNDSVFPYNVPWIIHRVTGVNVPDSRLITVTSLKQHPVTTNYYSDGVYELKQFPPQYGVEGDRILKLSSLEFRSIVTLLPPSSHHAGIIEVNGSVNFTMTVNGLYRYE